MARRKLEIREARSDPVKFAEYVIRDERGRRIRVEAFQTQWLYSATSGSKTIVWAPPEHGKTVLLSIALPLYILGNDPTARIAIIQKTAGLAEKTVRTLKRMIQTDKRLHEVFPNLRPARGDIWTKSAFCIERGLGVNKDPSVQAAGAYGPLDGSRLDYVIIDDLLGMDNTRTQLQRDKLWTWLVEVVFNRVTKTGKSLWLTNAWHPDDAAHRAAKTGTWTAIRQSAVNSDFVHTGVARTILWASQWTLKRLKDKLQEIGVTTFLRKFCNESVDASKRRFLDDWIARCLRRGRGRYFVHETTGTDRAGRSIYTGIDLGTSDRKDSDLSVLFTFEDLPDGNRLLLNIESGQWTSPEIKRRVLDTHRRYGSILFCESNAAQRHLRDLLAEESGIPILPFLTTEAKWDESYGVESIATEMFNGRWILPCGDASIDDNLTDLSKIPPELVAWIVEMQTYTPDAHTGDRLMACWIAREGARRGVVGIMPNTKQDR